jgi:hypothetical protein
LLFCFVLLQPLLPQPLLLLLTLLPLLLPAVSRRHERTLQFSFLST